MENNVFDETFVCFPDHCLLTVIKSLNGGVRILRQFWVLAQQTPLFLSWESWQHFCFNVFDIHFWTPNFKIYITWQIVTLLQYFIFCSLVNIYKELKTDIDGFEIPNHGYLVGWARQGKSCIPFTTPGEIFGWYIIVLLWNT